MINFNKYELSKKLLFEFILIPLILCLIFYINLRDVFFGVSFATWRDNTYGSLPIFSYLSKIISKGDLPLWINAIMGGIPIYNTANFSFLYPFYFLGRGLYSTPFSAIFDMHYISLFHILILYINTYILLRVLKRSIIASIFASTLFAFCMDVALYAGWLNDLASYSWLPLVIASIALIFEQKYTKTGIIIGTFAFSMLALACPAQPLIHAVFLIFILTVFYFAHLSYQKRWLDIRNIILGISVMAILSLLIVSPGLIPTFLDMKNMIRWLGNFPPIIGNQKMVFDAFLIGQLDIISLANTIFPLNRHFLLGSSHIGLVGALLAIFSVFKIKKNTIILPFIFVAVYSLLSSAGSNLGFAYINYHIPFLNLIREPGRNLIIFAFSASILAAFGFDYLIEEINDKNNKTRKIYLIVFGAYTIFTFILYFILKSLNLIFPSQLIPFLALIIFCSLFFIIWKINNGTAKYLAISCMAAIVLIVNMMQFPWQASRIEAGDYFTGGNIISHKVLEEVSKIKDINDYRVIFDDGIYLDSQQWAMNALYYDVRNFNAYFFPLPYQQFTHMYYHRFGLLSCHTFRSNNYFEMLGAKYIICTSEASMAASGGKLLKTINVYKIFEQDNALPRYFVVNQIEGSYRDENDFLEKIDKGYKYDKKVLVSAEDLPVLQGWVGPGTKNFTCLIKKEKESLNKVVLTIILDKNAILVFNEYNNKNWKVKNNGVFAKTYKVNLNQIGILLNKGVNVVEIMYEPTLFLTLLWIQRITIVCILIYLGLQVIEWLRSFCSQWEVRWKRKR